MLAALLRFGEYSCALESRTRYSWVKDLKFGMSLGCMSICVCVSIYTEMPRNPLDCLARACPHISRFLDVLEESCAGNLIALELLCYIYVPIKNKNTRQA